MGAHEAASQLHIPWHCINEEHCKRTLLSYYHHYVSEDFAMNPLKTATQIFKSHLQAEVVVVVCCFTIQMTEEAWCRTALGAAITPFNLR